MNMMKRSINRKTKISALFLDFNGVLCSDYFYSSMKSDYSDAYQYITQDFIINSKDIINEWMVGGLNYHQVNSIISKNTGLSQKLVPVLYILDFLR